VTRQFLYALGWVVAFLLVVEGVTGAALEAFYAPSATDAWASVAYIQDQSTWGWLVRGIHAHCASVLTVVAGVHLVSLAFAGEYRRPQHKAWWVAIGLVGLIVAAAITGFVLRWDQAGFWANKVEIGIAGGVPIIGDTVKGLALGGNDQGNLTLTRFHMLHVIALPALAAIAAALYAKLAPAGDARARLGAVLAMAIAILTVLAITVATDGVDLGPPANPAEAYDARPLWMVRWLFELRHLAGSAETIAALAAPAIIGGIFVGLPLLDRKPADAPLRARLPILAPMILACAAIVALTVMSLARDADNAQRDKQMAEVDKQAARARDLARRYGVPATGPLDVYATPPMWRARELWRTRCADCHDPKSAKRIGPEIGPGHYDRAWFTAFVGAPSHARFYGKTKFGQSENAMQPIELPANELAEIVELMVAETGEPNIDVAKRDAGKAGFEKYCSDCHAVRVGVAGASAPGLGGIGSRDFITGYIGNSHSPVHMGDDSEMPRFDKELSIVDRDALAGFVVWLRSATQADLDKLNAL